ncbi:zinc-binding protein A33-like [Lampris incognitus]|uniref:zinc-binding protein A33-like n=1 Tax=Lampris incognitus TaxID=2546036 RepID=UPI0024B4840A|nr:zinc-binding protein A33-like [Lampris incognitus]
MEVSTKLEILTKHLQLLKRKENWGKEIYRGKACDSIVIEEEFPPLTAPMNTATAPMNTATVPMSALGATGFISGKQSWAAEVRCGKDWCISAVGEPIKRTSTVLLNPTVGFWVISLCNEDTYWAQTSPRTRVSVKKKPHRITVEHEKGKVLIYHRYIRLIEGMFPCFSSGMYEEKLQLSDNLSHDSIRKWMNSGKYTEILLI